MLFLLSDCSIILYYVMLSSSFSFRCYFLDVDRNRTVINSAVFY